MKYSIKLMFRIEGKCVTKCDTMYIAGILDTKGGSLISLIKDIFRNCPSQSKNTKGISYRNNYIST